MERIELHFRGGREGYRHGEPIESRPKSIAAAKKLSPLSNLAVISVPGDYAAFEAYNSLRNDLHVFLFSDNVSIEDEVELKKAAAERGLLLMGPDCGTAIISGVGLGFSNAVRRGRIGIVGASGSGMQEISCLIHRSGEGISHAVGTGGRDLSREVGGRTFFQAVDALLADRQTEVLVLMSKHCDEQAARKVVDRACEGKKPIVCFFPGLNAPLCADSPYCMSAQNLEHAAFCAAAMRKGEQPPGAIDKDCVSAKMKARIDAERNFFSGNQRYLRALLTGGAFVDQACALLPQFLPAVHAYPSSGDTVPLEDPRKSTGHAVVDMGEDIFTRGRPHPIIDPTPRNQRILKEAEDETVRVLLLDVVLGYGAHPDPCRELAGVIRKAREYRSARGGSISCVVSICGTEGDPQGLSAQKEQLEHAGAVVTESSTRAALLAGLIAET